MLKRWVVTQENWLGFDHPVTQSMIDSSNGTRAGYKATLLIDEQLYHCLAAEGFIVSMIHQNPIFYIPTTETRELI